jgi:hypothetical protein
VPQEYLERFPLDQVPLPPVKEDDLDDTGKKSPSGRKPPDPCS